MPQSLVVGNGNIVANFDKNLQMTDFYFPFVGEENHTAFQNPHRVGVWTDNRFSWLSDHSWQFDIGYHQGTFVGNSSAYNPSLGLQLRFEDFVYTTHDILFRKVTLKNNADHPREIRLFFGHDFYLYGDKMQDTAEYEPDLNAVLHYRKERYLLVNGRWQQSKKGMNQYSVGKSAYYGKEGTWRDCEDGHLHGNAIEQGSVDSAIGFSEYFQPGEEKVLYIWVAAGRNYQEILKNNNRVFELGEQKIYDHTFGYWKEWANKQKFPLHGVSHEIRDLFYRSLILVRSQIDNRGAIIASSDSDIMKFNKDNYNYIWPRDGAFVSMALARANCGEVVRNFFFFCEKIITDEGFVYSKYTPAGSLGTSWHPKIKNGQEQLPIQEDESALILVALRDFYNSTLFTETVQKLFNSVVLKVGRFLIDFVDLATGLPKQSYDPWEEQRGVFSYTTATVYAGLVAAADLSRCTGHYEHEQEFLHAAAKIKEALEEHLYSFEDHRFYKKIVYTPDNEEKDSTVDASLAMIWELGVLPASDPRVISTMKAIEEKLWVHTDLGGIARYTGDMYHRNHDHYYSENIPGNPWIITTLWLANWKIEMAHTRKELQGALDLLQWVVQRQNSAGILPEQLDPFTQEPLSVGPLTWSHSTFVDTVLRFSEKYASLE
jgi:GH15 family glucan-1,4-alpha-glucosidase